jgi:site-specific DNA recombinase
MSAPRGPAGPATRRYFLAGLICCGTCGRRLESSWSNGRPAYRCRHGYTSAAKSGPTRPKNTYVREDQILPHLAALAILRDGPKYGRGGPDQASQVTGPARTAELIDYLRSSGHALIYDPQHRTLQTDTRDTVAVTVGRSH